MTYGPLKTWEITFQRANGTIGRDRFDCRTRQGAIHDFNVCYRHGNGIIILDVSDVSNQSMGIEE